MKKSELRELIKEVILEKKMNDFELSVMFRQLERDGKNIVSFYNPISEQTWNLITTEAKKLNCKIIASYNDDNYDKAITGKNSDIAELIYIIKNKIPKAKYIAAVHYDQNIHKEPSEFIQNKIKSATPQQKNVYDYMSKHNESISINLYDGLPKILADNLPKEEVEKINRKLDSMNSEDDEEYYEQINIVEKYIGKIVGKYLGLQIGEGDDETIEIVFSEK